LKGAWLLWVALTALTFAAMWVTAARFGVMEPYRSGDEWLLNLRFRAYAPLGWLALLAPLAAAAALIFKRWPRIFLGVLAFSAVAQCAILAVEAWAHSRPPARLHERWLG